MTPSNRTITAALVLATAIAISGWNYMSEGQLPPGVAPLEFQQAAREFTARYGRRPDRADVLSWIGDEAVRDGRLEVAVACFAAVPSDSRFGHPARHQAGQVLLKLHRAVEAERNLREFLQLEAAHPECQRDLVIDARQRLRHILEVELRFEERQELLAQMVGANEADPYEVLFYCFPSLLRWNSEEAVHWLEEFLEHDPADFHLRVALGRYRTGQSRLDEARQILDDCIRERPDDLATAAAMLACLYEQGDTVATADVLSRLPPPGPTDPWLLLRMRGQIANQQNRFVDAERCLRLALDSDPANAESWSGLAVAYAGLGASEARGDALRRAEILARIQNRLGWTQYRQDDPEPLVEIADLCLEIDLEQYARWLLRLAKSLGPASPKLGALERRLKTIENRSSPEKSRGS